MRASKEAAELARQNFVFLCALLEQAEPDLLRDTPHDSRARAIASVTEFLNAAKSRLPTETAYERDARRKAGRCPNCGKAKGCRCRPSEKAVAAAFADRAVAAAYAKQAQRK